MLAVSLLIKPITRFQMMNKDKDKIKPPGMPPRKPPSMPSFENFQDLTLEKGGSTPKENTMPVRYQKPGEQKQQEDVNGKALNTYARDITVNNVEGTSEEELDVRKKGRMGDRMVAKGLITEDQLNVALQEKKISGKMLGEILVGLGFI